ncbi:MAG: beta-lactamase family protein [Muribaculum sp.]|nr:beta-lactamase family protein [Muribaculum sp.]
MHTRKPKYHIFDFAIIATLLACLTCCRPSHPCHTDHGVKPCNVTTPLDSLFMSMFPGEEPGGIAVVMKDGEIIYDHAFGIMDLKSEEPITDSTMFNMASTSKIFTAVALMKLQEQGLLSIDDSLSKYFPEFKNSVFNRITIRNILTHSSGLPDLRPRNDDEWKSYLSNHKSLFVIGDDYRLYGREEEHIKVFQNLDTLEFEPGTQYIRHDPSYVVVAPLIERVTGIGFDTWMEQNIFKPAGMEYVLYFKPDQKIRNLAHAYRSAAMASADNDASRTIDSDNGKWQQYDYGEVPFFLTKADRGLYTSARDYMQWCRALYGGKIISDSSLKAIVTPYVPTHINNISFGLGTAVDTTVGHPLKLYHRSSNGGFRVIEGSWPTEGLYYIVMANRADWDEFGVMHTVDSILQSKGYIR